MSGGLRGAFEREMAWCRGAPTPCQRCELTLRESLAAHAASCRLQHVAVEVNHDLVPRGTLFPRMEIASDPGIETSHGQGTLNLLIGRYARYRDVMTLFCKYLDELQPNLHMVRYEDLITDFDAVAAGGNQR